MGMIFHGKCEQCWEPFDDCQCNKPAARVVVVNNRPAAEDRNPRRHRAPDERQGFYQAFADPAPSKEDEEESMMTVAVLAKDEWVSFENARAVEERGILTVWSAVVKDEDNGPVAVFNVGVWEQVRLLTPAQVAANQAVALRALTGSKGSAK